MVQPADTMVKCELSDYGYLGREQFYNEKRYDFESSLDTGELLVNADEWAADRNITCFEPHSRTLVFGQKGARDSACLQIVGKPADDGHVVELGYEIVEKEVEKCKAVQKAV